MLNMLKLLKSEIKSCRSLYRLTQSSYLSTAPGYKEVTPQILKELEGILGTENFSASESVREHHSRDESYHRPKLPDAVLFPKNVQQVSECVRVCHQHRVPVIPYGTGTGLEGGILTLHGGVVIDLTRMDQVLSASAEDFTATIEPGVTRKGINNHLRDLGVWFPIDPGADASVCGMAATSASGTNAVRYGTMRENVLNLEVVLADGSVMWTAGEGLRCRKTSAGYNLTNLFVGSEGTLGLITKATVKLYGLPESIVSAVCHFPDIRSAVEATVMTLQAGVPIARIELLDDVMMKACIRYSSLEGMKELPTLFLEFHGSQKTVEDDAKVVEDFAKSCGGMGFMWASDTEQRNKLWTARHNAMYAGLALKPGCRSVTTDVAVPISNLAEIVDSTKQDIIKSGLVGPIVGHVGDGNFHVLLITDPNNSEELKKAKQLADTMARRAISLGGTCTGEHGVGLGKRDLVALQRGPVALGAMRALKQALDPTNIMNPGKVLAEL